MSEQVARVEYRVVRPGTERLLYVWVVSSAVDPVDLDRPDVGWNVTRDGALLYEPGRPPILPPWRIERRENAGAGWVLVAERED